MVDICRYLENRFGRGATLSSQLTGLGFKVLPSKGQSAISLLADTSAWASMRKARRCLAFGQRELFEVFAKFEPSADIDASGSNLDQNLDRVDPDPIQIESHPEGDLARRLLATIRRNPLISRKLLAIELSVSERKIRDSLKILKDSGVIARQGPDHGGIWRISRRVAQNGVLKTGTSGVISKGKTGTAEAINEVIKEAIKNEHSCLLSLKGRRQLWFRKHSTYCQKISAFNQRNCIDRKCEVALSIALLLCSN